MIFAIALAMFTGSMFIVALLNAEKGNVWTSVTVGLICLVAVYGVAWIAVNHDMNMQVMFACPQAGQG